MPSWVEMKNSENHAEAEADKFAQTSRSLPISLLRAREKVMFPSREMLQESNISEQQWRVLRVVEEAGQMEQTAIAKAACLQLPSLTRILKTMEKEGLVARKIDMEDRRRTLVSTTEKGLNIIRQHKPNNSAIFEDVSRQFGKEKLNTLLDLLEEFHQIELSKK